MSGDLIRRQDAIDAINHICPIVTEYDCALLDRVDVRCVLSDLPSVEPERTTKVTDLYGKWGHCECGADVFRPDVNGWRYCPNCGARLEWE